MSASYRLVAVGVNSPERQTVQDFLEQEVEARCQRCGQMFGRVVFQDLGDDRLTPGLNVWEAGEHGRAVRARDLAHFRDRGDTRARARGPRTGSGIRMEHWSPDDDDSRRASYARKVCKCGDNRNWTQAKLAIQPVRIEPRGPTVYL